MRGLLAKHGVTIRTALLPAAQMAGLALTGWFVWSASIAPRMARQPLPSLIREALEYSLLAWQWGAAVSIALYFAMPKRVRGNLVRTALATSSTAVWFAPATILLSSFSPSSLAAALVLVVSATRLLYDQWRQIYGDPEFAAGVVQSGPFEPPRFHPLVRQVAPGLTVSFGIQAGILAVFTDYPLIAAAFFALAAAMLTLRLLIAGLWKVSQPANLPRSVIGLVLTIILASGLTVTGLSPYGGADPHWDLAFRSRPGLLASARALLRAVFYGEKLGDADEPATSLDPTPASDQIEDDTFPGVILWPEIQPHTTLVAPLPALGGGLPLSPLNPLSIPFAGEYWMFKPPYLRPPKHSFFRRGSPLALSFKTTDHRILHMEARQKLDEPVDPNCCSAIRVEVSNADRYPGTVSLELILLDGPHPYTLGKAPLMSRPDLNSRPVTPAREIVEFDIPRDLPARTFDQWKVIFHRRQLRIDRSARVSIERFVLVPRTL
jgi:hypothetical protein